ncbi:PI-PLC X domain-containing protein 3 [Sarcoptes scabiei]|nr:PI-PLC X domain-containing protein 3 [Sarcoptes scabiei]
MSSTMADQSLPKKDSKIEKLQEHVDEVSNIMQMNIDKIMERGSNLDNLQTRSEYLANNAIEYRTITTNLQRKMWWRNMKINVIVGLIIIVILIIIIGKWMSMIKIEPFF